MLWILGKLQKNTELIGDTALRSFGQIRRYQHDRDFLVENASILKGFFVVENAGIMRVF